MTVCQDHLSSQVHLSKIYVKVVCRDNLSRPSAQTVCRDHLPRPPVETICPDHLPRRSIRTICLNHPSRPDHLSWPFVEAVSRVHTSEPYVDIINRDHLSRSSAETISRRHLPKRSVVSICQEHLLKRSDGTACSDHLSPSVILLCAGVSLTFDHLPRESGATLRGKGLRSRDGSTLVLYCSSVAITLQPSNSGGIRIILLFRGYQRPSVAVGASVRPRKPPDISRCPCLSADTPTDVRGINLPRTSTDMSAT